MNKFKNTLLPKVHHINKGKRKKRRHLYKKFDPIVFKWIAERQIGYIDALTKDKEGVATYTVKSVTYPGITYYDLQIDDPTDEYCYIAEELTSNISIADKEKINGYLTERGLLYSKPKKKKISKRVTNTKNITKVDSKFW